MLPGIRFLVAAIVLSTSVLIFGLGAAALLRAAHEEVASVPTRRVMPEPVFAQAEPPPPTLALLRIEPAAAEKALDPPPAEAAFEPAPEAVPVTKVETEKLAALKVDDPAPAEPVKLEIAANEPAAPPPSAADTASSTETRVAAVANPEPPAAEAAAPPFELLVPPAMTDPGIAPMKTVALGSPAEKIEKPAEARRAAEKTDRSEIRKRQRAERAKERRRQAARRARLAAQQATVQPAADPFSQPAQQEQPSAAATTTRRRR